MFEFHVNKPNPDIKYQLNSKFQNSARGASACATRDQRLFRILNFGYCDLPALLNKS